MPVHDWNRVDPGIFHDFHHEWISVTRRELNRILRGSDYYALAVKWPTDDPEPICDNDGPMLATIVVRHVSDHRVVAVVEIVSPGNKTSQRAISAFTSKIQSLLTSQIHVSFVDVFPPTAIGEPLPGLPVFLTPFEHITVDMETTYRVAFEAVADVWQQVLTV